MLPRNPRTGEIKLGPHPRVQTVPDKSWGTFSLFHRNQHSSQTYLCTLVSTALRVRYRRSFDRTWAKTPSQLHQVPRRANSSAQPLFFSPDSSSPALPALRSVGSNGGDTPATRRSTREQLVPSVALANGAPSARRAPQRETGSSPHIRTRIPAHAMLVRTSVREEVYGGGSSGFWRRGRGAIHARQSSLP